MEPDLEAWDAWTPAEVARRFDGLDVPWCVAGGWAIDLFLGGQRRDHEDTEVAVPRPRFPELAARLEGFDLFVPAGGGRLGPFDPGSESHQTWVRAPAGGPWRLEVFREPSDGDTWICRRDERIRLPYAELIEHTDDGIPFARPEVVLLFKAKNARPKDEDDLHAALPSLDAGRRRFLAEALRLVHPGHAWLEPVEAG